MPQVVTIQHLSKMLLLFFGGKEFRKASKIGKHEYNSVQNEVALLQHHYTSVPNCSRTVSPTPWKKSGALQEGRTVLLGKCFPTVGPQNYTTLGMLSRQFAHLNLTKTLGLIPTSCAAYVFTSQCTRRSARLPTPFKRPMPRKQRTIVFRTPLSNGQPQEFCHRSVNEKPLEQLQSEGMFITKRHNMATVNGGDIGIISGPSQFYSFKRRLPCKVVEVDSRYFRGRGVLNSRFPHGSAIRIATYQVLILQHLTENQKTMMKDILQL